MLFVSYCVMRHDLVTCDVLRVLLCLCVLFNACVWFVCDLSREVVWSMVSFVLLLLCVLVCCCCFIVIECFVCELLCDDVRRVFFCGVFVCVPLKVLMCFVCD